MQYGEYLNSNVNQNPYVSSYELAGRYGIGQTSKPAGSETYLK